MRCMIIIFIPWISVGKKEKYFKMTSAELAQRVVKVTNHFFQIYALYDYGKYPKNSNTKASDKMTYANSVDPDQTAPEGAV